MLQYSRGQKAIDDFVISVLKEGDEHKKLSAAEAKKNHSEYFFHLVMMD